MSELIRIGGLQRLSTIDYPGHLSAVIFCQGCPWRCRYCHNPHLVSPNKQRDTLSWHEVKQFLNTRQGLLDAVVFSGGEPLAQKEILAAIQHVSNNGFLIGLHTSGAYPYRLKEVLPLINWIGLDIKASFEQYEGITCVKNSGTKAKQSLRLIVDSGIPFECRTTVHWDLLDENSLLRLAEELADMGVSNYHVQACRTKQVLDNTLSPNQNKLFENDCLWEKLKQLFPVFSVRSAV